ncbi:hypothetical protein PENSPDRAFT_671498 [Peniophora sp. CONT]|nr:hypothetical protein PENSPDRAFT_671498 [Peniophora sp. CONT]
MLRGSSRILDDYQRRTRLDRAQIVDARSSFKSRSGSSECASRCALQKHGDEEARREDRFVPVRRSNGEAKKRPALSRLIRRRRGKGAVRASGDERWKMSGVGVGTKKGHEAVGFDYDAHAGNLDRTRQAERSLIVHDATAEKSAKVAIAHEPHTRSPRAARVDNEEDRPWFQSASGSGDQLRSASVDSGDGGVESDGGRILRVPDAAGRVRLYSVREIAGRASTVQGRGFIMPVSSAVTMRGTGWGALGPRVKAREARQMANLSEDPEGRYPLTERPGFIEIRSLKLVEQAWSPFDQLASQRTCLQIPKQQSWAETKGKHCGDKDVWHSFGDGSAGGAKIRYGKETKLCSLDGRCGVVFTRASSVRDEFISDSSSTARSKMAFNLMKQGTPRGVIRSSKGWMQQVYARTYTFDSTAGLQVVASLRRVIGDALKCGCGTGT